MGHSKKFLQAKSRVEPRRYELREAIDLIREIRYAKFDETVEVAMRLGVDPRHADQMVRGTVVLPHGTGKSKRVLVVAAGDAARDAQEAGADFVLGEEVVEKIQGGPFTQELYREEESWKAFRPGPPEGGPGTLRRTVRSGSGSSTSACTCSGRVVPFEAILMSILVEERRAARELSRRIGELERRLTEKGVKQELTSWILT